MLCESFQSDTVCGTHDCKSNIFPLRSYSKIFLKSFLFETLLWKVLEREKQGFYLSLGSVLCCFLMFMDAECCKISGLGNLLSTAYLWALCRNKLT